MRDLSSYMMARAFTGHVIREMQPDAPVDVPAQPRRRHLRRWISSALYRLADLVAPVAEQREVVTVSPQ
jgi:hypothetical protein